MKNRIQTNEQAPDFTLADINGQPVRLSDYRDTRNVILVFNRGFA